MRFPRPYKLLLFMLPVFAAGFVFVKLADNHYKNLNSRMAKVAPIELIDFSDNIKSSVKNGFVLLDGVKKIKVSKNTAINWPSELNRSFGNKQLAPDQIVIGSYLEEKIAGQVKKEPRNPKFAIAEFDSAVAGGEITELAPGKEGRKLNITKTAANISRAMFAGNSEAEMAFNPTVSTVTKERLYNLGITKLIGEGGSDFSGSSAARIYNIKKSADLYDSILIEPGREFSFNEVLGEVDAASGYKAELVIKGDKIIPEYGGGICQVSTTLFRLAINSGLLITERKPHSLPVRYYRPQGFDATIYPGVVDLKFINDTGKYLLITTEIAGTELIFKIYGPEKDREVYVDAPSYYDVTPDGALKSVFTRTITYSNGQQKTERFYSAYRSPDKFESLRNPLE